MGFRCPKCRKDFGYDSEVLEAHYKMCVNIPLDNIMAASEDQAKTTSINSSIMEMLKKTEEENEL